MRLESGMFTSNVDSSEEPDFVDFSTEGTDLLVVGENGRGKTYLMNNIYEIAKSLTGRPQFNNVDWSYSRAQYEASYRKLDKGGFDFVSNKLAPPEDFFRAFMLNFSGLETGEVVFPSERHPLQLIEELEAKLTGNQAVDMLLSQQGVFETLKGEIELQNRKRLKEMREICDEDLSVFGIRPNPKLENLSKGQRQVLNVVTGIKSTVNQMGVIALPEESVVLLDEPESSLSMMNKYKLRKLIEKIKIKKRLQLVISTHDREFMRGDHRKEVLIMGENQEEIQAWRALVEKEMNSNKP